MGNCQAAEAATVVIQHGGNKVERIYWSVSAHEVMSSNPGHYVALVVPVASAAAAAAGNGTAVKQLKLLRPDDTLVIGQMESQVHRLGSSSSSSGRGIGIGIGRHHQVGGGGGQWKPALQSISEVGT
ncbi:hypothetical protein RHGRI_029182 [Rhododendron griersonianum]|uniref:Uncharacterized protein n=1 Tax=Rhododendron griersonianum TaxID=479676 RepID=A0AAV6IIC3_9ERIC|nr:hypothetical protein RHGRI_029182 [Rhododendron griersonianum]